jgi:hypothetical protein
MQWTPLFDSVSNGLIMENKFQGVHRDGGKKGQYF